MTRRELITWYSGFAYFQISGWISNIVLSVISVGLDGENRSSSPSHLDLLNMLSFRKLSYRSLWWEDRVSGQPSAPAITQLPSVQLFWAQTFWEHTQKMVNKPGAAPQPKQLC